MSGANQNALCSNQDINFKDGKRLIAVSRELELIAHGAPSPAAVYLEAELKNLSRYASNNQKTANQK